MRHGRRRSTRLSAWPVPCHGPYSADPRFGRCEAFEAAWGIGRRRLSRHGLPASSAAKLSGPPWLGRMATRRILDRRNDCSFNLPQIGRSPSRVRFHEARKSRRTLPSAPCPMRLLGVLEATLPFIEGGDTLARKLDDRLRAQLLAAMSGFERARQDPSRPADGAHFLYARGPCRWSKRRRHSRAMADAIILRRFCQVLQLLLNGRQRPQSRRAAVRRGDRRKAGAGLPSPCGRLSPDGSLPGHIRCARGSGRDETLARISDARGLIAERPAPGWRKARQQGA